jgi:hypothetical protein
MRVTTNTAPRRFGLRAAHLFAGLAVFCATPAPAAPSGSWGNAPPVVVAERPYRLGARPRPEGAVQASVADEELARWNVGGSADPRLASSRAGFHPAPRVLVDISVRSGALPKRGKAKAVLSEASLVAQARSSGYWPFRLCFEDGLRRDQALRGQTRVRFVVETSGRVKSERMAFTELKDRAVAKCLSARVRALRFSPAPMKRVHADAMIDLGPGDAPLPDGNRTEPQGAPPDVAPARLDEGAVARALDDRLGTIAACYAAGLGRDQRLWGRLAILMDVDAEGQVVRAAEHDSRFPDPGVLACAVEGLRGALLPPAAGGPLRLVWAVKLGNPAPAEPAAGRSGSAQTPLEPKRTVAEAVPPRVPVPE